MRDESKLVLLGIGAVALIAVCIMFAIKRHDAQQECINGGGVVHEYSCAMVSCGSGCFTQVCDWQCVQP